MSGFAKVLSTFEVVRFNFEVVRYFFEVECKLHYIKRASHFNINELHNLNFTIFLIKTSKHVNIFGQMTTLAAKKVMAISVKSCTGNQVEEYLNDLAFWRITVFREFPYLYEGDIDYERQYLQTFFKAPDSILVIAFDDGKVIGASTALPLKHETANVIEPFLTSQYRIDKMFYYGESVLSKPYRGKGIGKAFFNHRASKAVAYGAEYTCFCSVIRPENHPLRPHSYLPLDSFWQQEGFVKHPELICKMSWKDLDEQQETEKSLVFWVKKLESRKDL